MKIQVALNGEKPPKCLDNIVSGVGMIRSEYILRKIGQYITNENARFIISDYIEDICKYYFPNPVWYRIRELTTQEVNVFDNADEYIDEKHYILGLRGIRRY